MQSRPYSLALRCSFFVLLMTVTMQGGNLPWWSGTALTLPQGRWEKGLFQPLRYGQSERLEWSTGLLLNLTVPNLRVKVGHRELRGWYLASQHSFHYPTPLLRLLRRPGIGGLLAPDPDIPTPPHIFSLRNELLGTRRLGNSLWLTGIGGISLALKTGELDERTSIDIPVIFPRMAVYYSGYQLNMGLNIKGTISDRWSFSTDADLLLVPGQKESFSFELGGWLAWSKGDRFRILAGYLVTYTVLPFGSKWQLMPYPLAFGPGWRMVPLPILDIQWAGKRKVRK